MQLKGKTAVVCGGRGFIGRHLVRSLFVSGANAISAVHIKRLWKRSLG
jgi:NAD(P)-dependent dehydrogenase (short-subunit alcohol dehydrogenase family)